MNMSAALEKSYDHFGFAMDSGIAARASLGLVVLATDQTIEHEWRQLLIQPGVALYHSRLYNDAQISPEKLALMEAEIPGAVDLILPGQPLQVVAFGCTSGTMVITEQKVFEAIRRSRPGVACTTPLTGALAALEALGAARIALLTPYVASINRLFCDFIEAAGVEVARVGSFNHDNDNEVARIDSASLRVAVLQLGADPAVDAVFVSCTSLRMVEQIPALEAELGKPVISSNYAMAWHALRLAGIDEKQPELGRLFEQ